MSPTSSSAPTVELTGSPYWRYFNSELVQPLLSLLRDRRSFSAKSFASMHPEDEIVSVCNKALPVVVSLLSSAFCLLRCPDRFSSADAHVLDEPPVASRDARMARRPIPRSQRPYQHGPFCEPRDGRGLGLLLGRTLAWREFFSFILLFGFANRILERHR